MTKRSTLVLKIIALFLLLLLAVSLVFGAVTLIKYRRAVKLCEDGREIPRLDIDTGGMKILSNEDYISCKVSISGTSISEKDAHIRGRGNTTWAYFPKKPYRIKFTEGASLFGEEANKSWVLLALYNDFSALKDKLAFTMADAMGTDVFVPSYHYVELYLNGKYNGLYLLTDQVDENVGRCDIKESFTEEDTAVPFLVELDAYAPEEGTEGIDWFYVGSKAYAVKYPDKNERYTEAQFKYIKDYIIAVESACSAGSYERLSELVDIKSFIDYYIIQEVMGQPEINWKSVYMYKTGDGLMKMGPVWDFDWSVTGPSTGKEKNDYRDKTEGFRSNGNWFDLMYKNSPEFKEAFALRFAEVKGSLLDVIEDARAEKERLAPYYERNHLRWHWFRFWTSESKSYDEVIDWCRERINWIDKELKA